LKLKIEKSNLNSHRY